ncbi:MAG: carboxypeptidase regulatory-like domain-containing protein [Planctomycetes bacterium]|nr:carboxypeptidase regulatory-like domain-containing protein [Planctomycetota bacterium]
MLSSALDAQSGRDTTTNAIRGRVVDVLGQPVARATIELFADDPPPDARSTAWAFDEPIARATSSGDGEFRIDVPHDDRSPPGRLSIRATHRDFAPAPVQSGLLIANGLDAVVLRLGAGLVVTGRVVRPDGRGVANAEVLLRVEAIDEQTDRGLVARRIHTGADGEFFFGGLEGRPYRIFVAPGAPYYDRVVSGLIPRFPDSRSAREELIVRAMPAALARGRCVDAHEAPRSAVRVTAISLEDPTAAPLETTTDDDGLFVFDRAPSGTLRISAWFGPFAQSIDVDTKLLAARPATITEPQLESATVVLRAGDVDPPTSGHWRYVRRTPALEPIPGLDWHAFDVTDGSATFPVAPAISPPGLAIELRFHGMARCFVPLERSPFVHHVQLTPAGQISIRTETASGAPSPARRLRVTHREDPVFTIELRSDDHGTVRAEQLPPGSYAVRTLRGVDTATVRAGDVTPLRIVDPQPHGALELAIGDVPNGEVELHVFAADGSFRDLRRVTPHETLFFERLPAGRYGIVLRTSDKEAGTSPTKRSKVVEVLDGSRVHTRLP